MDNPHDGSLILLHDSVDRARAVRAQFDNEELSQVVGQARDAFPTASDLATSLQISLTKSVIADDGIDTPPAHLLNEYAVEQWIGTSEFADLRSRTVGNPMLGGLATQTLLAGLISAIPDEAKERIKQLSGLSGELRQIERTLSGVTSFLHHHPDDDFAQGVLDEHQQRQSDSMALIDNTAAQIEADEEPLAESMRIALREASVAAAKAVDDAEIAWRVLGGGYGRGPGEPNAVESWSTKDKLRLARYVGKDKFLQQIMELAGKMNYRALKARSTTVKRETTEIVGITTGDDLGAMLSSEMSLLANPLTRGDFYRRYAGSELLVYETRHQNKLVKGPIIVALDRSGSMWGLPDIWSKAVILAMLTIARLDKRDFVAVYFADTVTHVFEFKLGIATPAQILKLLELQPNGGTRFEPWMDRAEQFVRGAKYRNADVICVTDGASSVNARRQKSWRQMRDDLATTCFGIQIGADPDGLAVLQGICDNVHVRPLADPRVEDAALEALFTI